MAAVDYYLVLDGIKGESEDHKMKAKGAIDVESWSWGESQSGTHAGGGGGGAGKVSMQAFHFVMKINKASPELMLACAEGRHIKLGELTCRKAGKDQQEFLVVKMTDLLVSSYQTGGSGHSDIVPTDQVSLDFSKIEFAYKPQKPDGTLDAAIKTGWDVKANKKIG
ncbi:MAG: type VI secretion system tube protein Hcp [Gemmataceae bacterium]|nr:type VI secretion system tube protein Hcp [Gemmataceae bacterium]MCI0743064.1 type VI secretion system tube protein Hcp [Gemmataceae bacterium]